MGLLLLTKEAMLLICVGGDKMKKIKYLMIICLLLSLVTGCSSGKQKKISKNTYRQELTTEEITNGHASFEIEDKFKVDADITKQEIYKGGLMSYYQEQYCETKEGTTGKFKNNPTIFHKNHKEIEKKLNQIMQGKLTYNKFVIEKNNENAPELKGKYITNKGIEYECNTLWDTYNNALGHSNFFFCPQFIMKKQDCDEDAINTVKGMVEANIKNVETKATNKIKEKAEFYKNWLEKFIGTNLDENYKIFSLDKKATKIMKEKELSDYEFKGKTYEMIMFYKSTNRIPISKIDLSYQLKAEEKADKWAKTAMMSEQLFSMTESPVYIIFCNGEIDYVEADIYRYPKKEYKKNKGIISPNKILKQVIAFYNKKLIVDEVDIEEIKLEYAGYYGKEKDNEIKPVFVPIWKVSVYDAEKKRMTYFAYDAVTGECYTNEYIPW